MKIVAKHRNFYLFAALVFLPFQLWGAKAHVHGTGKLNIVLEKQELHIELTLPADNVVGFEHAPRTPKQKEQVTAAKKSFGDFAKLFEVSTDAKCLFNKAHVELFENKKAHHKKGDKHHHHGHGHADHHGDKEHAELSSHYVLKCLQPDSLRQLRVNVFKAAKGLEKLEVQSVTAKGQKSQTVTKSSNTYSF